MALNKLEVRDLYRERAGSYDITANLYYLIGFREEKYRQMAIAQLGLAPGDTAVEIGCGTGLNFKYVMKEIGESGRLYAIDLTDAMLAQAEARLVKNGWDNIELVQSDAAKYNFPDNVKGIYSSFALTLVPEYEAIIERAAQALAKDGRFVLLDLKKPDYWPDWAVKIGIAITRPFGVTLDLTDRKPWKVMKKYFRDISVTELYGGFAYIAVGKK